MESKCCGADVYVRYHKYGGKRWHCSKCGKPCEVVSCPIGVGTVKDHSEEHTTE